MILITLILVITLLFALIHYVYSYWSRKGFPYLEPTVPLGNISFGKSQESFTVLFKNLYDKSKEPFVGIYMFYRPVLMIRDPDLVKKILVDDFSSFHDRGVHYNEKTNPMSANLFSLRGKDWKNMRDNLSPTFTSGKLKRMFPTIDLVGDRMHKYLEEKVPAGGALLELKDLATRSTMDIIVSVFFGVEVNSFVKKDHAFNEIYTKLSEEGLLQALAGITTFLAPSLFEFFQLYRVNAAINAEMVNIVKKTIELRETSNLERKDLVQLLIQLRNTGKVMDDGDWSLGGTNQRIAKTFSIEQITAQLLIFFVAGLETTASAISYTLYELTQNEDVMEKLLIEIRETLAKYDGKINYDSLSDMKYLDLVLMESFRKYPALPMLNRECTKSYKIPGSSLTIDEGTAIIIPMMGLHRDPELFPNPEKFDPERFSEENKNFTPNAYIPFGEGPRMCIGLRQGKLTAKFSIVKILTNYELKATEKKEIEFESNPLLLKPKGGLNVKFTKIVA